MGLFGSDKQVSTSKSTTSADPVYKQGYEQLYNKAQTVADKPYNEATNKTIADFTSPQTQAFGQVQSNLGNYQPYMDQAAGLASWGAQGVNGGDIAQYMNPYQQSVIDATQQQFNTQNARQDQQLNSNTARAAVTGNSGRDVAMALQREAQGNAQNPVMAGLYQSGYQNAQTAAQADKARALQGASTLGNLGTTQQNLSNTDVASLLGIGNQQQGQQQNINDAASANAAAKSGYDMEVLNWLAKLSAGGAGMSQTTSGKTTTDMGGSGLGQILGTGLSLFSMLKDGGRVNGYAEGGSVYDGASYVPDLEIAGGVKGAGQAPSVGSQTGNPSNGMGEVLNSYNQAKSAIGGAQNLFQKANTTTDANGWATTSQPQSAAGWGNWLSNGGLGGMFGFAEGGRVEDETGLGDVFSNLGALPLVQPNPAGGMSPSPAAAEVATQAAPAPSPAEKSGLFGLGMSDAARRGLLTAGLGMMASRSRVPAMALGQGGLQGVQAYQEALEEEQRAAQHKQMAERQALELKMRQEAAQRETAMAPYQQRLLAAQAQRAEREAAAPTGELREVNGKVVRIMPDGTSGVVYDGGVSEKAPANYRWKDNIAGGQLEAIPGGPADKVTEAKYSEGASKAANFANMMVSAETQLSALAKGDDLGQELTDDKGNKTRQLQNPLGVFGAMREAFVPEGAANLMRSESYQKYRQAAMQWVRAKLRKESGATITPQEFEGDFQTYFPQPGDTPDVVAQKKAARDEATRGMVAESRGAYDTMFAQEGLNPGASATSAKKTVSGAASAAKAAAGDTEVDDGWVDAGGGVRIREKR